MKKSFFIEATPGVKLEAMMERLGNQPQWPTILLVPGLHSDLHEWGYFDNISNRLTKMGLQVYRFSFSGSGKSSGLVYDLTLTRQAEELKMVLNYIQNQPEVDLGRIGLLAQSFGVPTTMAALPLPIKSLVFTSGAYYPEKSIRDLFKDQGVFDLNGDSHFEMDYDSIRIGPQLWPDLAKYDLLGKLEKFKQPILIAHGKKDFIDWHWAKEAYVRAVSKTKKLFLHSQVMHDFSDKPEFFNWLMKRIGPWFKKTLV